MTAQTDLDPRPEWDVRCLRSALRAVIDTLEQTPEDLAEMGMYEALSIAREALGVEAVR